MPDKATVERMKWFAGRGFSPKSVVWSPKSINLFEVSNHLFDYILSFFIIIVIYQNIF